MRTSIGSAAAFGAALLGLSTLSQTAAAYGEEKNGFPNWSERVIHEWTNRAHADPQVELQGCGDNCAEKSCYTPIAPVAWNEAANHASRFHSDEMLAQDFFAHDSQCSIVSNIKDIYPGSCKGAAGCACQGGSPTCSGTCPGPGERMTLFGTSGGAENIAWDSAGDPDKIFKTWIFERSTTTACEFTSANGHRYNILKNTGSLGVGVVVSSKFMAVMDFSGNSAPSSKIPSGSHFPRQAASVDAWANWYDSAAPKTSSVNVDGACVAMTKKRGSDTNGAYSATLTQVGSGCHRYYFRFTDSKNTIVDYPTTGTLGIGPAGSCADWQEGAHTACGGAGSDAGGGGSRDGGGGGGAGDGGSADLDAAGTGGGGWPGGGGGGGGGSGGDGTGAGDAGPENAATDVGGGSGCAAAPGDAPGPLAGLVVGVAALCIARRRARR